MCFAAALEPRQNNSAWKELSSDGFISSLLTAPKTDRVREEDTMLAMMERLPLNQPFTSPMPLPSPTVESARALPGHTVLPSPTMLHSPFMPHAATPKPTVGMGRPSSSSSISSVQTPPPYDTTLMGVPSATAYSPQGATPTMLPAVPNNSAEEHAHRGEQSPTGDADPMMSPGLPTPSTPTSSGCTTTGSVSSPTTTEPPHGKC